MSDEEKKDVELKSAREIAEERSREIAEQAAASGVSPASGAAAAKAPVPTPEQVEEWKKKAAERDDFHDRSLRALADYRNLSRRLEQEKARLEEEQTARILEGILPAIEDLERMLAGLDPAKAADGWAQGMVQVRDRFRKALAGLGVERIEGVGRPFDPAAQEVAGQEPSSDHPPGTVVRVAEGGYRRRGRLLRPARVVVSSAPSDKPKEECC